MCWDNKTHFPASLTVRFGHVLWFILWALGRASGKASYKRDAQLPDMPSAFCFLLILAWNTNVMLEVRQPSCSHEVMTWGWKPHSALLEQNVRSLWYYQQGPYQPYRPGLLCKNDKLLVLHNFWFPVMQERSTSHFIKLLFVLWHKETIIPNYKMPQNYSN